MKFFIREDPAVNVQTEYANTNGDGWIINEVEELDAHNFTSVKITCCLPFLFYIKLVDFSVILQINLIISPHAS